MASDVAIANAAILRLGQSPITAFTDPGTPALLANNTYAIHRDALIRSSLWRFAIRRTSLAASATTPDWEFSYYYPLPADPYYCLRVLTIENASDYDWRLEGRMIATDIGAPLYLKYLYRVTDPNQFDSLFTETLIAKLAHEWCEKLTQDSSLAERVATEYLAKRLEAEAVNGSEGKLEPLPTGSWYTAHLS